MKRSLLPHIARLARRKSHGFTLIELMIAITISLVVLVALVALLVNTNRSNRELAATNSQIENGRFAIQLLQNDIEQAGFWSTFVPPFDDLTLTTVPPTSDVPNAAPDPCLAYSTPNWNAAYKTNLIGIPVQAYDAAPSGCSSVMTSKQSNTDVLVVRHANNCVPGDANCEADASGKLYFQTSLCETEITAGSNYVLDTTGFTLKNRNCTTAADKRKFISNIYYIRSYSNSSGDGIPTLVRSQFDLSSGTLAHQAAVPLIEGIDGFKVEIGVDNKSRCGTNADYTAIISRVDPATCAVNATTAASNTLPTNRGDGVPDGDFIRCTTASPCTADQLMNAVAVKIYVLARATEITPGYTDTKTYTLGSSTVGPFNDHYKRHLFSTTVRLTNVAGRRETP